jgi:hypothetical protein
VSERIAPNGTSGKAETAAPGRHESPSAGQLCGFTAWASALSVRSWDSRFPGSATPSVDHLGGWHRELETLQPINAVVTTIRLELLARHLGGQLKTGNLWTGQNRNFSGSAETSEFYFVPSSGAQIRLHFRPPAPRSALQHMCVMQ